MLQNLYFYLKIIIIILLFEEYHFKMDKYWNGY